MLFQISIFLLILSTAVLARDIPVWGYRIRAEFECNGLPLIGSVQSLEEVNECSQVILHLDILDREAVLELLGPFAAWNASVEITCSQSSILFADDKQPVITVFHNCMPASSAANSSSAEEKPPPRQSDSCRKWDIVVPPSNLGPARETPVMNMGIQELSQLGEKVECQSSVSLLSDQQPRELSFSQENGNGQGEEEGQKKKDEKEDEGGEEEEEEEASPEKGSTEMEDGTVVDVPEKTDEDQPIEEESVDGATSSTGTSIVDADAGE